MGAYWQANPLLQARPCTPRGRHCRTRLLGSQWHICQRLRIVRAANATKRTIAPPQTGWSIAPLPQSIHCSPLAPAVDALTVATAPSAIETKGGGARLGGCNDLQHLLAPQTVHKTPRSRFELRNCRHQLQHVRASHDIRGRSIATPLVHRSSDDTARHQCLLLLLFEGTLR